MEKNNNTNLILEDYEIKFSYKKSKSNLNISFNRVAFIFFVEFFVKVVAKIKIIIEIINVILFIVVLLNFQHQLNNQIFSEIL